DNGSRAEAQAAPYRWQVAQGAEDAGDVNAVVGQRKLARPIIRKFAPKVHRESLALNVVCKFDLKR
ncbi:MAG TPA: hypothetical protein PL117_17420, partial [Accumulibacter sp.]|uniref:hypothetical protein n=1 Tax=Accumulibacter sp. TaxID=2053492 RepID=UPI002B7CC31C